MNRTASMPLAWHPVHRMRHRRVLIRKSGERAWHAPSGTMYTDEASLEALLEESPSLLPGPEEDKPLVVVRQLSVRTGSVDLFGVSRSGAITVVECKLQANPEIRRSVVGQVFAYGAALWGLSFDELDRSFQLRKKMPLVEAVRAALPEGEPEWDESFFRNAVTENLATGRFRLVLAVDAITLELKRIVEYLNDHTVPEVLVVALELAYFTSDGVEVLQPQLYGQEAATRKLPVEGRQWDEGSFLAALGGRDEELQVARALLDWVSSRGLRVWYGRGRLNGSFYPIVDAGDRWYPLFGLWTTGRVELQFGTLKSRPPFDRRDVRHELLRRLNAIPGVEVPESRADVFPSFPMRLLTGASAQTSFLGALDWAVEAIRSYTDKG